MESVMQYKTLLIYCLLLFMSACMPVHKTPEQASNPVWPAAPAQPRVVYDFAFSNAEELGINKGFWQRLGEFFAGPENIQMVRPMAVAISRDGLIFVADPGVHGVHRFDLLNKQYDLLRLKDGLELPSPVALVSDKKGNVFISDSELGKIFWLTSDAEYAREVKLDTDLKQPTGLAVDASGHLFVVDTSQHQVLMFDKGRLLKRFGKRGKGVGEFNFPTMIWHHQDGSILVTDSLNFRIQKFDVEGRYLGQFGELGDASGYHARPKGLATDQAGRVYVVDSLFHNVQIFNSAGDFLLDIGEQGRGKGQFWLPTGIFIDDQKKIYVADSHNRRIQVFRYLGTKQ